MIVFVVILTLQIHPEPMNWCTSSDDETNPFCVFENQIYVVTVGIALPKTHVFSDCAGAAHCVLAPKLRGRLESSCTFSEHSRRSLDVMFCSQVPSRRSRVMKTLSALQIGAHIVDAYQKPKSSWQWRHIRESGEFDPESLDMLTAGEVAVSLSQRKALRQFLSSPVGDRALIFEDDFEPNGFGVRERLEESLKFVANATPPVDVLFLGRCHDSCEKDRLVGADLYRVWSPACLHAYSVNRRAAAAIIDAAKRCSGPHCPIDNVMRALVQPTKEAESTLAGYAISPQLFTQESTYRKKGMSLVLADSTDVGRMKSEGDHWVHALRKNNSKIKKGDTLIECKPFHERLLISNVNQFADRTALKPKPKPKLLRRRKATHHT